MKEKIFLGLFALLVAIQFFPPKRNEGISGPNAIQNTISMPKEVTNVLKISCYDCHSNQSLYPWYVNVQPVGWWMARHIINGKKHLNFDEWRKYTPEKRKRKLQGIVEVLEEDEMPLKSYLLVHRKARLSDDEKQILAEWAKMEQ